MHMLKNLLQKGVLKKRLEDDGLKYVSLTP